MPTVHFVTPWASSVPRHFASVGGEGDRSISVRCNDAGEARVLLRSEHAQYLTTQTEDDVAATLTTKMDAVKTLGQVMVEAATPMEAKNIGAFSKVTAEYDRSDATSVPFLCGHLLSQEHLYGVNRVGQASLPGWRDYQSSEGTTPWLMRSSARRNDTRHRSAGCRSPCRDW